MLISLIYLPIGKLIVTLNYACRVLQKLLIINEKEGVSFCGVQVIDIKRNRHFCLPGRLEAVETHKQKWPRSIIPHKTLSHWYSTIGIYIPIGRGLFSYDNSEMRALFFNDFIDFCFTFRINGITGVAWKPLISHEKRGGWGKRVCLSLKVASP